MARHKRRHRHSRDCSHDDDGYGNDTDDHDDDFDDDDDDDDEDDDDEDDEDGIDWETPLVPIRNETKKIGRNEPCPCGSGKKYKKCHIDDN